MSSPDVSGPSAQAPYPLQTHFTGHAHAANECRSRPRPYRLSPPHTKSFRYPDPVPVASISHPNASTPGRPLVRKGELAVGEGEGRAAGLRMKRNNGLRLGHILVEFAPPVTPCRLRRVFSLFTQRVANLDKLCCPVLPHSQSGGASGLISDAGGGSP